MEKTNDYNTLSGETYDVLSRSTDLAIEAYNRCVEYLKATVVKYGVKIADDTYKLLLFEDGAAEGSQNKGLLRWPAYIDVRTQPGIYMEQIVNRLMVKNDALIFITHGNEAHNINDIGNGSVESVAMSLLQQ